MFVVYLSLLCVIGGSQILAVEPTIGVAEYNISTPSTALASYWAGRDRVMNALTDMEERRRIEDEQAVIAKARAGTQNFMAGTALKSRLKTDDISGGRVRVVYSRAIQSEQRLQDGTVAIFALIKNVTPLPTTSVLTEAEAKERNEGLRFKYHFAQDPSGWKIIQVFTLDTWQSKQDGADCWSPMYFDEPTSGNLLHVMVNRFEN